MPEDRNSGGAPLLSAVLPTYNSAPFVSRAIESVLHQQGGHALELIIVDDCSSDATRELIQERHGSDPRIHLIVADRNAGPGAARNQAIDQASGRWIAPIDADDAWSAHRLSNLLPLCSEGVDIVFDNLIGYDQAAQATTGPLFPKLPPQMSVADMAADRVPGSKFNFGYLKPLVRLDFLRKAQLHYPAIRISEDLLFYLETLINGARSRTTSEAYYVYTTSVGQDSGRSSTVSATIPDDDLVANMLDDLAANYRGRLNADDLEAISGRADRLRRLAPANRLYQYWIKGQYLAAARLCLIDGTARQHLVRAAARRLFPE